MDAADRWPPGHEPAVAPPPDAPRAAAVPLLDIEDLSVEFRTRGGTVRVLDRVGLRLGRGEIVGVVGESGSGKSVMACALLGILDPAARISAGQVRFSGRDLLALPEAELRDLRGRELAMIFQNPRVALNPIRRVGAQLEDVLRRHTATPRPRLREAAVEALARVRVPDPARRCAAYPFELSGGQCQRVMIALALAARPALLVADEPTTGLDVTTQAAIMALINELARERRMATLFITHDLGLAADHCDRIVVMHAGQVVESAPTDALFAHPRHPYTAKLIAATPYRGGRLADLAAIAGNLPDLRRTDLPPCRFAARCERHEAACDAGPLPWTELGPQGHHVACRRPLA